MRPSCRIELKVNAFAGGGLGSLFHLPAYHRLHAPDDGLYIEGYVSGRQTLAISLAPQDGHWRSPRLGTFGAYAVTEGLDLESWFEAHQAVEAFLRAHGARSLELLLPPHDHGSAQVAAQAYLLMSAGYRISRCDLNYAIEVDARPFEQRVDPDHRRRLRNALNRGTYAELAPPEHLSTIVAAIQAGYATKGRRLSMSREGLEQMQALFPQRFVQVACYHGGQLAGAAIALRLSTRVLYIYCWSEAPDSASTDAVTVMAHRLYSLAQDEGIGLLDGGTASIAGDFNGGLARFKRALGMRESLKLRLYRELQDA